MSYTLKRWKLSGEPAQFLGKDFHLQIELRGFLVAVRYAQLSHIEADKETLEMFEIWDYWVKRG